MWWVPFYRNASNRRATGKLLYYSILYIIFHYFYDLYGVPIAIVSKNKEIQKKITENEENCAADPDLARTCKSALSDNLTVFPF